MSDKQKILVTSGDCGAALACVQSLGRAGYDVATIVNYKEASVVRSRFCREYFISPSERDTELYIKFLIDLLKKQSFAAVIPISDHTTNICSEFREDIESLTALVLPSKDTVDTADNKVLTCKFALDQQIKIPTSYFPQTMEDVSVLVNETKFPWVVKLPVGVASEGVFLFYLAEDLIEFFEQHKDDEQWPLIQKMVEGDVYGLTAVCERGRMLTHFAFCVEYEHTHGGSPPYVYSVRDPKLVELSAQIVEKLQWHGAIDFDFIRDVNGDFLLLEINPRFSGTLNIAYKLGLDLPVSYVRLATGESQLPEAQREYPDRMLYRSVLPAEFVWCYQNRNMKRFVGNLFKLNSKTNLFIDDPGLTIAQIRETRWEIKSWLENYVDPYEDG